MLEKKTQPESLVNTANVDEAKHSNDTKMSLPRHVGNPTEQLTAIPVYIRC
jgi:hypothetical protein